MKSLLAIFVLVSLLAFAHCFPGFPRESEEDERDERPRQHQVEPLDNDRDTIGIFPFNFNWRPIRFGFNPGLGNMRDLMKMMTELLNTVPSFDDIKPLDGIVPEGANSTSTTRVIDGNIVTVNETTYSDNNDMGGTFFRVRVVHIKPENETTVLPNGGYDGNVNVDGGEEIEGTTNTRTTVSPTQEETTPERSVETVEEFGNEIPRSQTDVLQA